MKNIGIDIITNYTCNCNCEYCFLHKMKTIRKILDVSKLTKQLELISSKYKIDNINIYGGEVSLLSFDYLHRLIDLCNEYAQVNIITNFTDNKCNAFLSNENVTISTSLNDERECNQKVESLLLMSDIKQLSIIQVVTPSLLSKNPKDILNYLNLFKKDVSFLQYSPSEMSKVNYDISNEQFSSFMVSIIDEFFGAEYDFNISNIDTLENVINNKYNPMMQSILFINPFNEYMSIEYDEGLEYFHPFASLTNWENRCTVEKKLYAKKCSKCEYYGRCYAEHLKDWKGNDECCGMKSLVKWYEKNIY